MFTTHVNSGSLEMHTISFLATAIFYIDGRVTTTGVGELHSVK